MQRCILYTRAATTAAARKNKNHYFGIPNDETRNYMSKPKDAAK